MSYLSFHGRIVVRQWINQVHVLKYRAMFEDFRHLPNDHNRVPCALVENFGLPVTGTVVGTRAWAIEEGSLLYQPGNWTESLPERYSGLYWLRDTPRRRGPFDWELHVYLTPDTRGTI